MRVPRRFQAPESKLRIVGLGREAKLRSASRVSGFETFPLDMCYSSYSVSHPRTALGDAKSVWAGA